MPIVNVHGFLDQSRYLPDRRDLNRSFPGSPRGSIAARLANLFIQQIMSKADFGIDLHTGALNRSNMPQIRANLDDPRTLDIAMAFGAPVVVNANIRDGSLRACAAERGMSMLIYEAGEALRFDETSIRAGLRGILNVMRHIGMLPANKNATRPSKARHRTLDQLGAGLEFQRHCHARARLGSTRQKRPAPGADQRSAGRFRRRCLAPFDGIVIGPSNLPLAHEGDALFQSRGFP